jgi:uncharacterized protein YcbX
VKICWGFKAAAAAAAIIPRTENIPSIEPKTSSATRLPDSRPMSSVVWIARTNQPRKRLQDDTWESPWLEHAVTIRHSPRRIAPSHT